MKNSTILKNKGRKSAGSLLLLALVVPALLLIFMVDSATARTSETTSRGHSMRIRVHDTLVWTDRGDIEAEIHFGSEVAARIIGRYGLYDDKDLTLYVNLVARTLAENSNRPELYYTVGILDTDIINAFATPGGFIFITRGAINVMKNEAELAGAIAHEMIHINQKHIVKELKIRGKSGGPMATMGKLIGGAGETFQVAFSQAVDGAMNVLFKNGYQQTDELEADTMGVMLASASGYEPTALVDLFERIVASEKEISATDRGVIASMELAKGSGKKPGDKGYEKPKGLIAGTADMLKRGVGSVAEGVGSVAGAVGDTTIVSGATGMVKKGVTAVGDTAIVSGATGMVKKGVGAVGDTAIVKGTTGLVKQGVGTVVEGVGTVAGAVVGTVDSTVQSVADTALKTTAIAKITNVSYLKQLHPPFNKRIEWIENTIESQGLAGGEYRTEKGRFVEYTKD